MSYNCKSNVGHMPELTEFDTIYSAVGRILVVHMKMKDSMAGYIADPHAFPDLHLSVRADMARGLAKELLRCADAIDAGLQHPSLQYLD